MLRRLCSIIGIALLLNSPPLMADEIFRGNPTGDSPAGPGVRPEGPLLTSHDLAQARERVRSDNQRVSAQQTALPAALTPAILTRHPAPQRTRLFDPLGELLDHGLPHVQELSLQVERSTPEKRRLMPLRWTQQHAAAYGYRVKGALRIAQSGSLAGADGTTVDGNLTTTLEAQAGGTQQTPPTTSVKGRVGTQVVFHPGGYLSRRSVERSFSEKKGSDPGKFGKPGIRFLLATHGVYELNPSTGEAKTQGELVGSLTWLVTEGRFEQDPWGMVSFRWQPSVSCAGGGPLGTGTNKAEKTGSQQTRFTGRVRGDLRLNFLTPRLVASGDYQYGQGLISPLSSWDLTTLSWTYQLSAHVSFGGSFTSGKRLPSVQRERNFTIELGVKF